MRSRASITRRRATVTLTALTYGPQLYVDARYPNGVGSTAPTDGTVLQTWTDLSGNGRHLTQATLSRRPVYRTTHAAAGNVPAVEFDGIDDQLTVSGLPQSADVTVYVVFQSDVQRAFYQHVVGRVHNNSAHTDPFFRWLVGVASNTTSLDVRRDSTTRTGTGMALTSLQARKVVTFLTDDVSLRHNGVSYLAAGTSGDLTYPNGDTVLSLGANAVGGGSLDGSVCALAVYAGTHDTATQQDIENHFIAYA